MILRWYEARAINIRTELRAIDRLYEGRERPHEVKLAVIELEREARNDEIVARGLSRAEWDKNHA